MDATSALIAAVICVPLLAEVAVPLAIGRLPEPPAVELPEPGSEAETEMDRALRREGPKVAYRDLAREWPVRAAAPILTALLACCAFAIQPSRVAVAAALLAPAFALLVIVDWRTRLLPRAVVRPLAAIVALLAVIEWVARRDASALTRELVGGLLAWLIFGLLWFVRKAGMGLGDVRLAFPLGMLVASVSWNAWLLGLYASFVAFVVFALGLMVISRDRGVLKRAYPFGPFMIAGAYAGLALGTHVHLIA
jgi:leader peptidase (prepilin peptidase)/N-methyltransferase